MPHYLTKPRRLRYNSTLRAMIREFSYTPDNLIYPIFVVEDLQKPRAISSMPGQFQWTLDTIHEPVLSAISRGIKAFMLFGVPAQKDQFASFAVKNDSIVCRAIKNIKERAASAFLITDVCLCAYTENGHCGIMNEAGMVADAPTCDILAQMALAHAKAGADMVAPSDMMDGRVRRMRHELDKNSMEHIPIMSYSAKYSSSFYGPFREAAASAPAAGFDRKTYQMDPANARDSITEMRLDIEEGADILMVKPAMAYLDILARARAVFECPLAVYQVSGEYAMLKAASEKGWIDEKNSVIESIVSMRRAGADLILTYYAPQLAEWYKEENT